MSTNMKKELILASLHHDLGKFGQRAAAERSESLKETYCPKDKHHHTHLHVLNTDHFIEKILPLPQSLRLPRSEIAKMAANHHKPDWDSLAESCLVLADYLASGADRYKDEEQDEQKEGYITARLVSIFEEIQLKNHNFQLSDAKRYRLETIDENPFPEDPAELKKDEGQAGYKAHWEDFVKHLKENKALRRDQSFNQYLISLLSSEEQYLWCVPASSFKTIPDISLYDHGFLTASLAQALYEFHQQSGGKPDKSENDKEIKKFLLYGGDLSGIQNFIFGINPSHSAGVAKLYRARSFFLQMISKSLVLELLNRLGLFCVAQVMDAGGKFMLILANTEKTQAQLLQFEKDVELACLHKFKGTLSFNTGSLAASFKNLLLGNFNATLNSFFDQLEEQKLQKFQHFIQSEDFNPVLEFRQPFDQAQESPQPPTEAKGKCQICEIEDADEASTSEFKKQFEGDHKVCRSCCEQVCILGKDLANKEKTYFCLTKSADLPKGTETADLLLGWKVGFLQEKELDSVPLEDQNQLLFNRKDHKDYAFHAVAGHAPLIEQKDCDYWEKKNLDGQQRDEKPKVDNPKTFEMIAHSPVDERNNGSGKTFLGAMKADVDNLGFIFSIGFEGKEAKHTRLSISRFASLSRMLNHFFAVELIKIIEKDYSNIYVVFAGGDDVFLLGPWVELIEFSRHIQEQFTRFTAHNKEITLSAGLGVFKPILPIKDIARLSEKLLEDSKGYESDSNKNAVSLFGETVSWERYDELIERGKFLNELLQKEIISTAFVYRLLTFGKQKKAFEAGKDIKAGIYLSHLSYAFRNIEEFEPQEDYYEFLKWHNQPDYLRDANIPLHFSLYKNRKNERNEP